MSPETPAADIEAMKPIGIILSGGPSSVYDEAAPTFDPRILDLGVPVLGICYGMQLACRHLGAVVESSAHREFGRAALSILDRSDLFGAIPERTTVWMSHGDQITGLADANIETLGKTPACAYAAGPLPCRWAAFLRRPVSPGGDAHASRHRHPPELHLRDLQVPRHVAHVRFRAGLRSTASASRSAVVTSSAGSPAASIPPSPRR